MSILLIPLPLAQILLLLRFPVLLALLPLALSALHLLQVLLTLHPVLIPQSQDLPFLILLVLLLFLRLPLALLSIWLPLFRLPLR